MNSFLFSFLIFCATKFVIKENFKVNVFFGIDTIICLLIILYLMDTVSYSSKSICEYLISIISKQESVFKGQELTSSIMVHNGGSYSSSLYIIMFFKSFFMIMIVLIAEFYDSIV